MEIEEKQTKIKQKIKHQKQKQMSKNNFGDFSMLFKEFSV